MSTVPTPSSLQVDVRKPSLQVILRKNVARSTTSGGAPVSARFAGQSSVIDLTPWLAEGHPVRVTKSVREPAGTFSLSLADRMDSDVLDTIYAVIEPMDTIEIRASSSSVPSGQDLPIMMRAFVTDVQRMEGMAADGKPTRTVDVTGHDYGKILQILQFFLMPRVPDDAKAMITSFPFFTKYGDFSNIQEAGAFISALFSNVVNPYLTTMATKAATPQAVMQITPEVSVTGAKIAPFGIGTFNGGTAYQLIRANGDIGPWNEFFIEDRDAGSWGDAGPYAVYRPNPFMDVATGAMLLAGAVMPAVTKIDSRDVVSMTVGRSDANVANYFWVDAPRYLMNYGSTVQALSNQSSDVYITDYGNVDPTLYGVRKMHEVSQQGALAETDNGNGTAAGTPRASNNAAALDWINQRRADLYAQNRDNIVLESGSMRLKGQSSIRAGTYLSLARGQMQSYFYITEVTHDITPFGNWFSETKVERGTSFVERIKQTATAQAPYLSEMVWKQSQ